MQKDPRCKAEALSVNCPQSPISELDQDLLFRRPKSIGWICKGAGRPSRMPPDGRQIDHYNKDMWKKLSKTAETIKEVRQLLQDIRNERYDLA